MQQRKHSCEALCYQILQFHAAIDATERRSSFIAVSFVCWLTLATPVSAFVTMPKNFNLF
jgi:hypothetical protein